MSWKDILYFQRGSRIAVIILLILIMLIFVLNAIKSSVNSSEIILQYNDSIIAEFDNFRSKRLNYNSEDTFSSKEDRSNSSLVKGNSLITYEQKNNTKNERSEYSASSYHRAVKLSPGETISLNSTDTTLWKMIPGIGSAYSKRIVKYRALLGGYVRKEQLLEVYGVDSEMYSNISPYIEEDTKWSRMKINELEFRELLRHPYLSYEQVQAIVNLRDKKGNIVSIDELAILDEFTNEDIYRLKPYLEF